MSGHGSLNILIVDDNDRARAKLIDQLRFPDLRIVGESSFGTAASSWASQLEVDVVIVAIEEPVARALRTVELLTTGPANCPIIAVSSRGDRETMRKAMLAGTRDFIVLPVSDDDLRKALFRAYQMEQERRDAVAEGHRRSGHGTIITVFGIKGGIGKTVTAVNIATGIAQATRHHVALVDADLQFGDCAVMLDLVPERTLAQAIGEADPAKPHLIDAYLTDHASHLALLAGPANPGEADQITPTDVEKVLLSLAATHDFVVVDISPHIDAVTVMTIDLSSMVLMLVTPEVPCVRRTKAALTLLEEAGYSRDKVKLVVNRTARRAEVPDDDLRAALGYPIYAEIPDDRAIAHSVTRGVPVVMSGARSAGGRAYMDLGRKLAGVSGGPRHRPLFSWRTRRDQALEATSVPAPPNPLASDALLAAWESTIKAANGAGPATESLEKQLEDSWGKDLRDTSRDLQELTVSASDG